MLILFIPFIFCIFRTEQSLTQSSPVLASRILQDNPSNPTGPNMGTVPGIVPLTLETLTPAIINSIAQQTNQSTAGNYQLVGPSPSQTVTTQPLQSPNTTIQISGAGAVTTLPWVPSPVESLSRDAFWISARGFISRLNISYFSENQIINLLKQPNSFNTNFNITFVSVKGYIQVVVSVANNLSVSLSKINFLNSTSTVVDISTQLYQVIESLLRNIFYDFTKSPISLLNGTVTTVSSLSPVIYNLNYQSAAGVYGFTVKVVDQKLYILGCNLISVKVETQTVPVLASINLLVVDGNFEYINSTIKLFFEQNQITDSLTFQKVIIWTSRGGNQLVYYLTLQIKTSSFDIGVIFNLTSRATSIAYFRNNTLSGGIITSQISSSAFREVTFLSQIWNQTFLAIDLAARSKYPMSVVGPITKIETRVGKKGTDYRLTYLGNGKEVQVEYSQS